MTTADQLIRDIEAAFASVELGAGLTLHEAAAFEGTDYCTAEERASVRALDPWLRWQDIPDSALEDCEDQWSFDEEGFNFHLPAYMRWHLRKPPGPDPFRGGLLCFQLQPFGNTAKARKQWEQSWDNYTPAQRHVIARFLEFVAFAGGHHAVDAQLAWESFWHKFTKPPTLAASQP